MKADRLNSLADLALAVYNHKRAMKSVGVAGDFIKPKIEKVAFQFMFQDMRAMNEALTDYYGELQRDKEAPQKLRDIVADLCARTLVVDYDAYELIDLTLDTNELHAIERACVAWLAVHETERSELQRRIKAIQQFFEKGKAL